MSRRICKHKHIKGADSKVSLLVFRNNYQIRFITLSELILILSSDERTSDSADEEEVVGPIDDIATLERFWLTICKVANSLSK